MQIAPSVKAAEWQRLSLDDPASPDWGRAVEILKDRIQKRFFPFGENWYETGGTNKLKFTSYERDSESANDYAMFRTHIPRFGRFNRPDPLAGSIMNPQSLNRYAYVVNDPVNLIDPLGLTCYQSRDAESWNCRGQIIGGDAAASQWQPILWDLLDGVYVPLSMIDPNGTGEAITLDGVPEGQQGQEIGDSHGRLWIVNRHERFELNCPVDPNAPCTFNHRTFETITIVHIPFDEKTRDFFRQVVRGSGVVASGKHIVGFYVSSALLGGAVVVGPELLALGYGSAELFLATHPGLVIHTINFLESFGPGAPAGIGGLAGFAVQVGQKIYDWFNQ